MAKEIERAGIATVQICSMKQVANMVGSPRVIASRSVLHPTGDPGMTLEEEKLLRRKIVDQALSALTGGDGRAA